MEPKDIHCCLPILPPLLDSKCTLRFNNITTPHLGGNSFKLSSISGQVEPGQILAVMGSTGSGKTTFLSVLAGRCKTENGFVSLNNCPISKHMRRTQMGYVQQQDLFFPYLTLRETLLYTAKLRLSPKIDRVDQVDTIINTLGLEKCKNTRVGDDISIRGLSGGEKKRLSVATELITNPAVLLMDEPTSGLSTILFCQLIIYFPHFPYFLFLP